LESLLLLACCHPHDDGAFCCATGRLAAGYIVLVLSRLKKADRGRAALRNVSRVVFLLVIEREPGGGSAHRLYLFSFAEEDVHSPLVVLTQITVVPLSMVAVLE